MLILSLFPGMGLLDKAFEEAGFCVVRGPDVLWGGDVRNFHPMPRKFDGIIGGPPCQIFTELVHLVRHNGDEPKFGNLIPEFERCVAEAEVKWFLMENVRDAPLPVVGSYQVVSQMLSDLWVGGLTDRKRRISFGVRGAHKPFWVDTLALHAIKGEQSVTGDMRVNTNGARVRKKPGGGVLPHAGALASLDEMCRLQGLPPNFLEHSPFTSRAKRQGIGNGVPLSMGRAIASAVKKAVWSESCAATVAA